MSSNAASKLQQHQQLLQQHQQQQQQQQQSVRFSEQEISKLLSIPVDMVSEAETNDSNNTSQVDNNKDVNFCDINPTTSNAATAAAATRNLIHISKVCLFVPSVFSLAC